MISTELAQKLCRLYFQKDKVLRHLDTLLQVNVLKSSRLACVFDYDRLTRIEELLAAKKELETIYKSLSYFFSAQEPRQVDYLRRFAFHRSDKGFYALLDTEKQYKSFRNTVLSFKRHMDSPNLTTHQLEIAEEFIL